MKRKIEVFTASCPACDPVVSLVKELTCSNCEVIIHDVATKCDTNECISKMEEYGVKRLPAVVVNGILVDCCKNVEITREDLVNAGIGK